MFSAINLARSICFWYNASEVCRVMAMLITIKKVTKMVEICLFLSTTPTQYADATIKKMSMAITFKYLKLGSSVATTIAT